MFFTLGLPYFEPELTIAMLVIRDDLTVAHFAASIRAMDLALIIKSGKWAADTHIW